MTPKSSQSASQRVPRRPFGRTLDSPWELEGLCWEIWGLLGRSLEVLGSSVELLESSLGVLGNDLGALSDDSKHFGMIFEPFFFPCCACCGSQHLALFWSFLGRCGLHRSRSSQNGRDRFHSIITNEIAVFSLTRELANSSGTKPKQCWDELRIHMNILSKTGKITS